MATATHPPLTQPIIQSTDRSSMGRFLVLWVGAMINNLGSGMTAFGAAALAYQLTGSASAVSAVLACALVPPILLGPLAGVAADRHDRRLLMALGDGGGIGGIAVTWWAVSQPEPSIAVISIGMLLTGLFTALSEPAFKASITDVVSPDDYQRSSALMQLVGASRLLLAPAAAGLVLAVASIEWILAVDAATVLVTVAATLAVRRSLASAARSRNGDAATATADAIVEPPKTAGFLADLEEGVRALVAVRGVMVLLGVFVLTTFAAGLAQVLFKPLMLPRISVSAQGALESVAASGMIAGSALIGAFAGRWRSHRTLITGLLAAGGFLAVLPFGGVWWVALSGFLFFASLALINTGADVLVRSSLPNGTQGRAWGLIGFLSQFGFPVAYLVAGPLADLVFEPLLADDGPLASTLGTVVGVGPGRGISLIFVLAGAMIVFSGAAAGRSSSIAALEPDTESTDRLPNGPPMAGRMGHDEDHRGGLMTRMLRADVRRTRVTSFVLAGLIAMAALLAAVGGGVLTQLTGAAGRLFTAAHTPDIVQMHAGAIDTVAVEAWVDTQPDITDWQISTTLPIPTDELYLGSESEARSVLQPAVVTQHESFDLLLDLDNEVLTVGPGEIAMPLYYRNERGVEIGDTVSIRFPDERFDFTVTSFLRDSMMNPTLATSKRLLISPVDHEAIAAHVDEPEHLVEFVLADRSQTKTVSDAYGESGLPTNGPRLDRGTFFLLNVVSHGIGIAVLTLLALLMVAVAAIALRFAFLTAVERDLHEIGVMKAIGLPEKRIRRLYLTKYVALALAGGLIGTALSVPATRLLTGPLRQQLGEPDGSWLLFAGPLVAAAVVVLAVVVWCALMLRRLGRITTMDALRSGTTSNRRRRWLRLPRRLTPRISPRLSRSHLPSAPWMGVNAIARNLRTHRMLLAVLTLCTFLILVPLNLWTTVSAPSFVTYLGTGSADLRLELRTPEAVEGSSDLIAELEQDADIARVAPFVTARFEVLNTEGETEHLTVEVGDHDIFPLSYLDGTHPDQPNEVSVSSLAADTLGAEIGDTIDLEGASGSREVTLVGIYQDMTNGGRTAKGQVSIDGEPIVWRTVLVDVADGVDITDTAQRLTATHPEVQTIEMAEFADQTLGELIGQTGTLAVAAAICAIALAALIATMFAQMVIARDGSQIAIQRSIGVADRSLRVQYLTRFLVVLIAGIALGTVLVATAGQWLVAGAMGQLGAPALRFDVAPLLAYIAVPAALTATVVAAALIATGTFDRFGLNHLTEE
ncbi:MAG: MFS transporter [Acidimicrobiia bacterium]|nr:MFS transporter [Acidimicrobiia bacterium]